MSNYDNPFDLRRFVNLASPQEVSPLPRAYRGVTFGPTMLSPQDFAQPEDENPYVKALGNMGAGKALDAYRTHLTQMPKEADYEPSKWRRLGAALTAGAASFGRQPQNAIALGESVRDAPYNDALNSWQMRGAGLKEQAGLEAADQTAQLARYKALLEYQNTQADNERADRTQRATEAYQRDRINLMKQQGWKDTFGPNGELILYNPTTGERVNTGMPTAKTTELGNAQRTLNQGDARVQQGWANVGLGQQNVNLRGQEVGLRGQEVGISGFNAQTGRMNANTAQQESQGRMAGMGNNQVPPTEQFQAEAMAVREALKKNPDWKGWVDSDGMIKRADQYNMFQTKPSASDPTYQEFLRTVEEEKRKILGLRPPGSFVPPTTGNFVGNPYFTIGK